MDDLVRSLEEAIQALRLLASQVSGVVGSTDKADCMAVFAMATLRNIEARLPDLAKAVPNDPWEVPAPNLNRLQ